MTTIINDQKTASENYFDFRVNIVGSIVTGLIAIGGAAIFGSRISPNSSFGFVPAIAVFVTILVAFVIFVSYRHMLAAKRWAAENKVMLTRPAITKGDWVFTLKIIGTFLIICTAVFLYVYFIASA